MTLSVLALAIVLAGPAATPSPVETTLTTTTSGSPAEKAKEERQRMLERELEEARAKAVEVRRQKDQEERMRLAEEAMIRFEQERLEEQRRRETQMMSRLPGAHEELSWAVEPFTEKSGWRAGHPALEGTAWGDVLAARVTEQLEERRLPTRLLLTKLTEEELRKILAKTGLEYLVDGGIESLKASGAGAKREVELAVTFRLRRKNRDVMRTVQKRTVKVRTPAPGAVSAAAFEELAVKAAGQIADRLAEDIPKDVLAERG